MSHLHNFLTKRPRRNRRNEPIRDMLAETSLELKHLVYPLFIMDNPKNKSPEKIAIKSLPGLYRWSLTAVLPEIESCLKLGLRSFALFPIIDDSLKNSQASEALNPSGLAVQSILDIKKHFPQAQLFSDIALDPFSSDGHDGLVSQGEILNDETLKILAKMAVLHAKAGADYVCPSDMMDGRVAALRSALDQNQFTQTGILSYSAKYCSSFYGPFREALDSAPKAGDKKTYQMDFRNRREALLEAQMDINEGADIVMVKPALAYLDVIRALRLKFTTPIAAYNVSGEYAMIKFAAQAGAINEEAAILETLTAIRRAGADVIFTYFAKQLAESSLRHASIL